METVSFRPEMVRWWLNLEAMPSRLGRVHRWPASGHGPGAPVPHLHQHHVTTLVLCLIGVARIEHARRRIDLTAGDAVVVEAGAWHRHATVRAGSVTFGQGFIAGRSDWILTSPDLQLFSSVPEQPSLAALDGLYAADDEDERQRRLADHLRVFTAERSEPIHAPHPAYPAMEMALWTHLHLSNPVEAMVRASGLSRAQAYRVFTACSRTGPALAVRTARCALARRLLKEGSSEAVAAERCGFTSIRALRRALAIAAAAPA
jgi:AraC-like DNA-binding protein